MIIVFDDRPIAANFNEWLADHLAEEQKITGNKPSISHVTLPGGPAIKDTTDLFGLGGASAAYYLRVQGQGVMAITFQSLDPGEPAIWEEIAKTFNPNGMDLP